MNRLQRRHLQRQNNVSMPVNVWDLAVREHFGTLEHENQALFDYAKSCKKQIRNRKIEQERREKDGKSNHGTGNNVKCGKESDLVAGLVPYFCTGWVPGSILLNHRIWHSIPLLQKKD